MSRVGKKPVPIPDGVEVTLKDGIVYAKGPKGGLEQALHPLVDVKIEDSTIHVVPTTDSRDSFAMQGLTRTLIANMVGGVSQGFVRDLEIVGVGYRAEMRGNVLVLNVGYSNPVEYHLPDGVTGKVEKQTNISLESIDKVLLGRTAATVRGFRRPEPYKGKGIRYKNERVRRKVGKAGSK
ncbi:MAG: 50S ribosomal protein L6 [Deltaproteobacteria bacterium]|nr:50S ribosomal protein L6 [Deltaproteobacteria bacterium]